MNNYVSHIEESILLKLRSLVGQGLHYSYLGTGYVCYNLEENKVECDSIAIRNRGKEEYEDEYVGFDIGIVFHCGPKILIISSVLSISGGLFVTSSKEAYDNLKNECNLKEKWGK